MTVEQIIAHFDIKCVFHFTDTRNLPSIRAHGLLSWRELQTRKIMPAAPGGNDWSHEADAKKELDAYVHLCLFKQHPMEYQAKKDGRLTDTVFLPVSPKALLIGDLLFAPDVSNKKGVSTLSVAEASLSLDLDVVYRRHNWRQKEIQTRLKAAERYEVLVRDAVAAEFITFPS